MCILHVSVHPEKHIPQTTGTQVRLGVDRRSKSFGSWREVVSYLMKNWSWGILSLDCCASGWTILIHNPLSTWSASHVDFGRQSSSDRTSACGMILGLDMLMRDACSSVVWIKWPGQWLCVSVCVGGSLQMTLFDRRASHVRYGVPLQWSQPRQGPAQDVFVNFFSNFSALGSRQRLVPN
jgi:hypothetical protein